MVNGIRIIYPRELNNGFYSRFCVGFWVRHETPEEGRMTYRLKGCEYEVEDNSSNIVSD